MSSTTVSTGLEQTTGTWVIDPSHSRVGFSAKHAMVATVRGQFTDFSGSLTLDGSNPAASSAEVTIATASINTSSEDRDNHVRSADFLDVESHPEMTFRSTGIKHQGGDDFVMAGDLTIRGTTRPVELEAELEGLATDPFGNERIGFSGATVISRKDFGLTWNVALEAGGLLVAKTATIEIDAELVHQG